jgi:hypothetical protein
MAGIDSYTKLLLQFDDQADGATTFTDTSGNSKSVETVGGSAQIDTAIKKFSNGASLYDGNGDYIEYADHADWDLDGVDWTIDMWIYPTVINANKLIWSRPGTVATYINLRMYIANHGKLAADAYSGTSTIFAIVPAATVLTLNDWNHIALDRYGNTVSLYANGSRTGQSTGVSAQAAVTTKLRVGGSADFASTGHFAGSIDEFRWSKGVSRYQGAASYTMPDAPYSVDSVGGFLTTNKGWM